LLSMSLTLGTLKLQWLRFTEEKKVRKHGWE